MLGRSTAFALVAALGLTLQLSAGVAQLARTAPPTEASDLARQLMTTMGAARQMDAILPMITQQMAGVLKAQKPQDARVIDEVFAAALKRFVERQAELIELIIPLYAQRFTVAELREMVAFFNSPVGQRWSKELPGISQESMQVGMQWGQKIGRDIENDVRRELQQRGVKL